MTFSFQDELRRHLKAETERPCPAAKARPHVDDLRLRRHFLQRLREHEDSNHRWVMRMHREWTPRIEDFARYIENLEHPDVFANEVSTQILAAAALDAAISCLADDVPLVTRLELQRISEGFFPGADDMAEYSMEARLTRLEPQGHTALTGLGRVFLRLRGKDATRWLLTAEVLQSQGNNDPWRVSKDLLEVALTEQILPSTDWDGTEYFPFDDRSLARLLRLGVLSAHVSGPEDDADVMWYFVPESMADLVRSVLDGGPWHAAVTALLEDERSLVVPTAGPVAVEATIEQTRMIAHEVRNALGPVRYNVDELLSEGLEPDHRLRVEAAKKGVVRVLDFVDQMVATSELITEPATAFDVEGLFREVLGWIDGTDGVELAFPSPPIRLRAYRPRLLRAFLDVIRNALQSTTPAPPVRISAERHDREVHINVDDGGPGVPPELRTRIFDDGFTTRPGGSGFGLAFLRQVVERELRGTVSCEHADLGGARFTITIPDAESEP